MAEIRFSTYISESTQKDLEQYAEAHGVKQRFLVEQALLHHFQALRELPANIVIPPRITITPESFEAVTGLIKKPRKPTRALRDVLAGTSIDDDP